ncbi:MAG TPA: LapA family protein [Pseudonocardia sp.]
MADDPTRATARPGSPLHGSVGPEDPHADPATNPAMRPVHVPEPEGPTVPTPAPFPPDPAPGPAPAVVVTRTRTGGWWTGLVLSAVVLLFLLIFILQNNAPMQINFLAWTGTLPSGVALLLSAVAGLLLVAIPGGLRILQLRRAAKQSDRRLR